MESQVALGDYETLIQRWRKFSEGQAEPEAKSWLDYIGLTDDFVLSLYEHKLYMAPNPFPTMDRELIKRHRRADGTYPFNLRSYPMCIELAEQMPDEFLRWKTLHRLRALKETENA